MKKQNKIWICGLGLLLLAAVTAYFYSVNYLKWNIPLYAVAMAAITLEGAAAFALLAAAKEKTKKKILLSALLGGLVAVGGVFAISFVINVLIFHEGGARYATVGTAIAFFGYSLLWTARLKEETHEKWFWKPLIGVVLCVCVLIGGFYPLFGYFGSFLYGRGAFTQADPVGFGVYTEPEASIVQDADLYIAPNGSDENDGSFAHPLATLERARDLVRAMDKTDKTGVTVALTAGDYSLRSLSFTSEDGGTESCPVTYCAYGDGEVILNGGKTISPSDFSGVTDEAVLSRLTDDAAKNVVCADLTKLGLTAADWGKLYSVGGYSTASHYDGDTVGPVPCVLYYNGVPQTVARYPDSGFLTVQGIVREGEGLENSKSNHSQRADWATLRNPETTVFTIDKKTADRINGYASLDTVWLWTALMYNWADSTSPLKSFDYGARTLEPAYVSTYGAVPGTTYYIFNVIEELDTPGEWYLDRDTGMLYLWPESPLADAEISLSLSTEDLITVTDAPYLRFEGLTLKGTRGGGFNINSSDVAVNNCVITGISGVGVRLDGYRNAVTGCELSHIGGTGVDITGGDRETLTPGENRVENCLIHDYSEVALTAGPGVSLYGVGNVCAHNEFYNSPQQAIFYGGSNNVIEFNLMHEVALLSDDCSAIYAGRRWDCGGSVVRYNAMYGLGDKDHRPNGIYWDDGMSGQTAYGNLIVNCRQNGFLLGGGRDLDVHGNILINCETPVCYDDRARDGALNEDSWFKHSKEGADMQQHLEEMPWRSELWQKAYPYTANWSLDYADPENPNFLPNPANSSVSSNLIVQYAGSFGRCDDSVYRFSDISGNAVYQVNAMKKLFVDPDNGDYTLRSDAPVFDEIPGFEQIPIGEIGRY